MQKHHLSEGAGVAQASLDKVIRDVDQLLPSTHKLVSADSLTTSHALEATDLLGPTGNSSDVRLSLTRDMCARDARSTVARSSGVDTSAS